MSDLSSSIQHGYLVLADISGYTSFLSQTELDHAHEILSDLLETILRRFKTLLTIHKIEGDAIFGSVSEARLLRGETLLELIEATYTDFRERTTNVRRHTTCTCRACQSIPMLDLKFVAHHGDFIVQDIDGRAELAGSDVNLVHRLLKNHVTETTGWRAYALFTRASLEHMDLKPEGLLEAVESYEHLGEVRVCVMDLHARYEELMEKRRVVVGEDEAMIAFSEEINAAPPVVWSWLNDPARRALFAGDPGSLRFIPILLPRGRTGRGATTHCVHGERIAMREKVLDWKPFDYYTVEQESPPLGTSQMTFRLEELAPDLTRLSVCLKGHVLKLPAFLNRPAFRFIFTRVYDYRLLVTSMRDAINTEMAGPVADEESLRSPASL
ncbi:MAG: DUF2652 domain-containing protein [Bacteroidota bacterium]